MAAELGLFGLRVKEVAETIVAVPELPPAFQLANETIAHIMAVQEATVLQAEAAALLSPTMRALAAEFGLLGLTVEPAAQTLDQLLAQMTMQITDTAAAASLQEMALAALSPEMRAMAEQLGLFGLRVKEVQEELPALGGPHPSASGIRYAAVSRATKRSVLPCPGRKPAQSAGQRNH